MFFAPLLLVLSLLSILIQFCTKLSLTLEDLPETVLLILLITNLFHFVLTLLPLFNSAFPFLDNFGLISLFGLIIGESRVNFRLYYFDLHDPVEPVLFISGFALTVVASAAA